MELGHACMSSYVNACAQVYRSVECAVKVAVQWMYRPDEAISEGAHAADGWRPREIMFSRHVDEIEPHQVMHPIQVSTLLSTSSQQGQHSLNFL